MTDDTIVIYTDGGCSPNPGPGGWAAILISPAHGDYTRELSGYEPDATNNRMELTAAIMALRSLKRPSRVALYTDSQYLKKAFTDGWLKNWQRNGWRSANKKPVKNRDLWMELIDLADIHHIDWHWVKGHAENPMNERCDRLVQEARMRAGD